MQPRAKTACSGNDQFLRALESRSYGGSVACIPEDTLLEFCSVIHLSSTAHGDRDEPTFHLRHDSQCIRYRSHSSNRALILSISMIHECFFTPCSALPLLSIKTCTYTIVILTMLARAAVQQQEGLSFPSSLPQDTNLQHAPRGWRKHDEWWS